MFLLEKIGRGTKYYC